MLHAGQTALVGFQSQRKHSWQDPPAQQLHPRHGLSPAQRRCVSLQVQTGPQSSQIHHTLARCEYFSSLKVPSCAGVLSPNSLTWPENQPFFQQKYVYPSILIPLFQLLQCSNNLEIVISILATFPKQSRRHRLVHLVPYGKHPYPCGCHPHPTNGSYLVKIHLPR